MDRQLAIAVAWLALATGPPLPGTAAAGEIRGVLRIAPLAPAAQAANPYPGTVRALARPQQVARGLVTDAVIYVETLPTGADVETAAATAPRLGQKDQAFVPRVLAVAAGTTVEFPNFDPIYHNVFSLSPARRFDLGKYPRGQSRRVAFDRPGLVNVYCEIHSDMEAFILVLPHHAFARPDADGSFRLPPLPAGRYVLRVWHPDRPGLRREVVVPETGAVSLELDG
jgi:plastocyanin